MQIKQSSYIAALAYFDIFSFPLSRVELEVWQWQTDNGFVNLPVEEDKGFYFLAGKRDSTRERQRRYRISVSKLKRAKLFAKIFRLLPSVQMIAVCNSLGYFNARLDSDIDLFIIVKPGTVWLTRFWLQGILKLLRARPFDRGTRRDSICLTFFLTSDHLDIGHLQIAKPDVYLHYWLTQLIPLYDPFGYYQQFLQANSYWLKKHLPNYLPYRPSRRLQVKSSFFTNLFIPLTFSFWEKLARGLQLKIMPDKLKELAGKDSRVILSNNILKFHSEDNRLKYFNLWQKKIKPAGS